jgi:peptidoglycan DL-endopeptidase LytE
MKGQKYPALIFVFMAVLLIPGTGFSKKARTPKKAIKTTESAQNSAATATYIIQSGDSLYKIAKTYHTTSKTLKALNKLSTSRLKVGQTIVVPVAQSAALSTEGSDVNKTALRSGINKKDEAEQESGAAVLQGQSQKTERSKGKNSRETIVQDYKVRQGDSLYKIAKSFKITPKTLRAANNLKNDRLKVGQNLKVPVERINQAKDSRPTKSQIQQLVASQAAFRAERPEPETDVKKLPLRERLVEAGFQMLGIRYRFSGNSEKTGLDCSAMVKNLFSKFDIHLPRSSREQYQQGQKIDRENLEVGDLVFFSSGGKTPTHVGVYIGNNKFMHAARRAKQVIVSDLNKYWYEMRYLGARRIMNLWWEEPEVPSDTESADK